MHTTCLASLDEIFNHFFQDIKHSNKEREMGLPNLAFCGPIASGKTAIAKMFFKNEGGRIESFAEPIKTFSQEILDTLNEGLIGSFKTLNKGNHRDFLVLLGEKLRNPAFGAADFWINKVDFTTPKKGAIYIDDLRHPAEAQILKSRGFKLIRLNVSDEEQERRAIKRDGKFDSKIRKSSSETNQFNIHTDFEIDTTGKSIEEIYEEILNLLNPSRVLVHKTLFYNTIPELQAETITLFDNPCIKISLSKDVLQNIGKYVNDLTSYKSSTCNSNTWIEKYNKRESKKHWFDGFVAEFAIVQLLLQLGVQIDWDDTLRPHNVGDNGDIIYKNMILDIKAKSYNEELYKIFYCIKENKKIKADYYVFTYIKYQYKPGFSEVPKKDPTITFDDILNNLEGAEISIIGVQSKSQIEALPNVRRWEYPQFPKGKYIDYNKLDSFSAVLEKLIQ